jgi:hypothetical protein
MNSGFPPCLLFVSFWSTYVFRPSSTFDLIGTHDCYLKLKSELLKKVHFSPFADILEVIGGIAALPKRFDFVMFAPRRKTHVE